MAETSDSSAPEMTLRQRTREGTTRFDFHPDRLDYSFSSRQGTQIERRIPWNVVPSLSRLRRNARPDRRVNVAIRVAAIVLIFLLASHLKITVSPLLLISGIAVLIFGVTLVMLRHFRLQNSILPTTAGNIVILGDSAHDTVLARLRDARRAFFRRFATIDSARSTGWNLQRLRWMLEQDVITLDEYTRAQQSLLPAVTQPLLRAKPKGEENLRIEQHFCNALFGFDFRAGELAYRRRTGNGVETAMTVDYLDLPEPTTAVQVGSPSELLSYLTLWLMLIGIGYGLEMLTDFPRGYFDGPDGLGRGLLVFGPGVIAVGLAIVAARRFMRVVCTKLPQDIFILRNRQHDDIFAELKRRRITALQAKVEPDPLLSPAAQANLYALLQQQSILEASEIPPLLARHAALQEHLGLVGIESESTREPPDEMPAPQTAPRPTIH
jgi:hypothetical protein